MVSRRADRNESDTLASLLELGQGRQTRPRREPRRGPRVEPRVRVRVNVSAALHTERLQTGEIVGVMDPRQRVRCCLAESGHHHLVVGRECLHALHDGGQPRGSLGVARTAVVLRKAGWPGEDQRRHCDALSTLRPAAGDSDDLACLRSPRPRPS